MTRTKFFSLTATVFTLLFGVFVFPTTAQAKVDITTGTNGDVKVEFLEDGTNSVYVDGTVLESGQTRKSTMVPGNVLEVVNEVKNSGGTICAYDGQKKATTLQGADMGFYVGGDSKVVIKEIASKEVKINNLVVDFGAEKSFTDKDKSGAKFVVKNNMTKLAGTIAEDSSNSSGSTGSNDSNSGNSNSGNTGGSTNSGNTDSGSTNSGNTSGSTNSGNTSGSTSGNSNSGSTNSGNTSGNTGGSTSGNTNNGNTTATPAKVITVPVTANAANAIKKFDDVSSKNKYWSYVKAINKRGGLKGLTLKRGYKWDGKKGQYVKVSKKKSGTYLDMYSLGGIHKNAKSSSGYISRKDCITMLRNLYGKKYVPVSKKDLTNTAATQKWLTGKLTKIAKNRHVGIKWNSTSNRKLMKLEAMITISNCFKINGMDPAKSYSYKA